MMKQLEEDLKQSQQENNEIIQKNERQSNYLTSRIDSLV